MTIPFDPVLVSFGSFAVRWFGVLALLGLGVAVLGTLREMDGRRLPRAVALDALAWAMPAGIVFGRVVHVLGWWDYYFTHVSEIWQLGLDGLSLWGGLVGGGAVALARLRATPRQAPPSALAARVLDAAAPPIALGIALGRLGAFVDGSGQGLPANLPWATQYAHPLASTPDFGVPRHPAQLYDAAIALGLWLVLGRLPRAVPAGARAVLLCVSYASARIALGAVRADPAFLFGLQIEQLLALGVLAFGAAWGIRLVLGLSHARLAASVGREQRPREDSMAA